MPQGVFILSFPIYLMTIHGQIVSYIEDTIYLPTRFDMWNLS